MYICPICKRECSTEEEIKKHSNRCWRKANPHYKSKTAPRGETIVNRKIDNTIADFFNTFNKDGDLYDG